MMSAAPRLQPLVYRLALLVVVVVAGFFAVKYTDSMVARAKQSRDAKQTALNEARQKLFNAGAEKEVITLYLGKYQALQDLGFIGAEQRVNWVDGLRSANRSAGLFGVQYQISQQETFALANEVGGTGLPMKQSPMKLTFPMLHEGDLMSFFRALAAQRNGIFMLNSCAVRRAHTGQPSVTEPNLNAECELSWVTISEDTTESETKRP